MKSIIIKPRDKKEFDEALSLLPDFGKERNRLSLEDDDEIGFAFLMNVADLAKEGAGKVINKKTAS